MAVTGNPNPAPGKYNQQNPGKPGQTTQPLPGSVGTSPANPPFQVDFEAAGGPFNGWGYNFEHDMWLDPQGNPHSGLQYYGQMAQEPWFSSFTQQYQDYNGRPLFEVPGSPPPAQGGGNKSLPKPEPKPTQPPYTGYDPPGGQVGGQPGDAEPPPAPPPTQPSGGGGGWSVPQNQWSHSTWLTDAQKKTLAAQGKTEADYWRPPNNVQNKFQNWLFDKTTGKVLTTSGEMRDWSSISPQLQQELQQQWWYNSAPGVAGSPNYQQQPTTGLLDGGGTAPLAPTTTTAPAPTTQQQTPWTTPTGTTGVGAGWNYNPQTGQFGNVLGGQNLYWNQIPQNVRNIVSQKPWFQQLSDYAQANAPSAITAATPSTTTPWTTPTNTTGVGAGWNYDAATGKFGNVMGGQSLYWNQIPTNVRNIVSQKPWFSGLQDYATKNRSSSQQNPWTL